MRHNSKSRFQKRKQTRQISLARRRDINKFLRTNNNSQIDKSVTGKLETHFIYAKNLLLMGAAFAGVLTAWQWYEESDDRKEERFARKANIIETSYQVLENATDGALQNKVVMAEDRIERAISNLIRYERPVRIVYPIELGFDCNDNVLKSDLNVTAPKFTLNNCQIEDAFIDFRGYTLSVIGSSVENSSIRTTVLSETKKDTERTSLSYVHDMQNGYDFVIFSEPVIQLYGSSVSDSKIEADDLILAHTRLMRTKYSKGKITTGYQNGVLMGKYLPLHTYFEDYSVEYDHPNSHFGVMSLANSHYPKCTFRDGRSFDEDDWGLGKNAPQVCEGQINSISDVLSRQSERPKEDKERAENVVSLDAKENFEPE